MNNSTLGQMPGGSLTTPSMPGVPTTAGVQGVPQSQLTPAVVQQMVAQGLLPASVLQGLQPQQQDNLTDRSGNGLQQAGNNGPGTPGLGLSPGRQGWMGTLGTIAGRVNPLAGAFLGVANASNGMLSGQQQLAAMSGMTGVPENVPSMIGMGLSGATGANLSDYSHGLGGYGDASQGGVRGMYGALDPGVDGPARAMAANAAQAVNLASQSQVTQNPQGYMNAVRQALVSSTPSQNGGYGVGAATSPAGPGGQGDQGMHGDEGNGDSGGGYAIGGVVRNTGGDYFARKMAKGSGLVKAVSPGRTDAIHASVPKGGYVVPADAVSGLGQGNTIAGAHAITGMLKKTGAMKVPHMGNTNVKLSGGEFFIHPHHLAAIGKGNPAHGAAIMDHVVKTARALTVHHALGAAAPK